MPTKDNYSSYLVTTCGRSNQDVVVSVIEYVEHVTLQRIEVREGVQRLEGLVLQAATRDRVHVQQTRVRNHNLYIRASFYLLSMSENGKGRVSLP